ncbi:hypothetical protein [Aliiroseovarius sp. 2305UL8-7]|uniref:hypothetical protein n=1 Tax=Aliiroseovarius conchicola TaxID=3121637 RepID=UPI0035281769
MKYTVLKIGVLCTLLTACQMGGDTSAEMKSMSASDKSSALTAALSGKTLAYEDERYTSHADGRLTGTNNTTGTWEIRDGKWCRTIVTPEKWKGSQCQTVVVKGDKATFIRNDGSKITYTIL